MARRCRRGQGRPGRPAPLGPRQMCACTPGLPCRKTKGPPAARRARTSQEASWTGAGVTTRTFRADTGADPGTREFPHPQDVRPCPEAPHHRAGLSREREAHFPGLGDPAAPGSLPLSVCVTRALAAPMPTLTPCQPPSLRVLRRVLRFPLSTPGHTGSSPPLSGKRKANPGPCLP